MPLKRSNNPDHPSVLSTLFEFWVNIRYRIARSPDSTADMRFTETGTNETPPDEISSPITNAAIISNTEETVPMH